MKYRKIILTVSSHSSYLLDMLISKLREFNMEDTIIISGTYRSGSTWLMELLETLPSYYPIFEPLNKRWYPAVKNIIKYTPYIPQNRELEVLREYFSKVLTGNIAMKSPHLTALHKFLFSKKLVVKFVRANTMFPWIVNTFNTRATYFIIRHPCATIASQLATGFFSRITAEQLLNEINKVPELAENEQLVTRLRGISSEIGRLAAIWAFENYIPLASKKPYPWYTVIYERLVVNPEYELRAIFGYIGEEVPDGAIKRIKTPSKVTRKTYGREYIGTPKQLLKWREKLSERQVEDILKVVSWFGMDFYTEEPEPDYDALMKWKPPWG